jgi:3-methyladenine DNA glycosylase AlkD
MRLNLAETGTQLSTKALATRTRELLAQFDPGDLHAVAEALQAVWLQGETYGTEGVALLKAEQVAALKASGVKVPALKAVGKEVGRVAGKRVDDFLPLARLWDEYGREGRIVASVALGRMELTDPNRVMPVIRELCRRSIAWADCDQLAMQGLEPVVRKKPEVYLARLATWIAEENKWVGRAAVTVAGRLPMKRPEYTAQCLGLVEPLLTDPDLDVRRAVSSAIRMGARGDHVLVREFLRQHAGSDDQETVWTLCDAIRSVTKSLLPEFASLLPVYEAWQGKLTGRARRSVESAVKTLRSVQR